MFYGEEKGEEDFIGRCHVLLLIKIKTFTGYFTLRDSLSTLILTLYMNFYAPFSKH